MIRSRLLAGLAAAALTTAGLPAVAAPPGPAPAAQAQAQAQSQSQAQPFTYRDMIGLNRLADPQVAPDGRTVAYALTVTDVEANRRATGLWVLALGGDAEPRRLAVSDGGASTPRWGADGHLYFLSGRSGSSQVWRTDAEGAAAVQVTDLPLGVDAYRLSPAADRIAVALAVDPEAATLAEAAERAGAARARASTGQVYDRLFARHWDSWGDGTRNHLFALALTDGRATGEAVWVTRGFDGDTPSKPFGDDGDFVFAPDGRSIVFSARVAGNSEPWSTNFDLWRADATASTGDFDNLTPDNPAWDAGPVFSPDGRTLAYRAMARPGFEADRFGVVLRDMETGRTRQVAANWDRSADSLQWSRDGRSLYAVAGDTGQTKLFSIDVNNGMVVAITGPGHVGGVAQAEGGFVFARDALDAPSDLWFKTYRGRDLPRRLTQANPVLADRAFGEAEQFSFPGWNDETVHAYVIKPAGYVEGRRYPVAFLIHGGPQGSFGDSWSWRWNPQTYAGAGYAVVMIDFHGSTGYGQAFTDSISQHWGDRPLEDLQKGWAAAQDRYPFLDGSRACALGASYGGYMINWIAGQWPDAFRCAVNHAGVFDTFNMGFATEELWFTEWENGGTPWEAAEAYQRFNPAHHVRNWRTPTLVTLGDRDFRVPTTQSLAAFTALQRRGIESRLVVFPDENHWILKPANSLHWHDEVFGWLDRHIGAGAAAR